jgi:hypothetical protein
LKGFWGLIVIIISNLLFILLGGISNTEYFNTLMLIVYLVLLSQCVYTMMLINRVYSLKLLVSWILISITPAAVFSINFYLSNYKDNWFWAYTWAYVIPFFIVIIQIIYIIFLLNHKAKNSN